MLPDFVTIFGLMRDVRVHEGSLVLPEVLFGKRCTAFLRRSTTCPATLPREGQSTLRQPQRQAHGKAAVRFSQKGFGVSSSAEAVDLSDLQRILLPQTPDLEGRSVKGRWNPVHLAFLGDAVWELFVRNHYFSPPTHLQTYYKSVQNKVRAEAQALFYEVLLAGPLLSNREREILNWGHNAKVVAPKRFSASGMHVDTYKRATALECLVGYLYLTNGDRLQELVHYLLQMP